MKITECRVNHLENPLGYEMSGTRFSWKVEDAKGKRQKEARILISLSPDLKDPLADTGWTEEADSLCTKVPVELIPCTRYYWQVQVRSDADEEATSELQFFETSKMDEEWHASWIGCGKSGRSPIYSKMIEGQKQLQSARLYICGLGLYEARLNGRKIGDEYLTPYCNDYNTWLQYQTYDLTQELKEGGLLSVELGDGWYAGRFGFNDLTGEGYYGDSSKLIAEIRCVYEDGSVRYIGTDESWTLTRGNITFSNIYDGEHRDDSLPEASPEPAKLCEPPKGKLTARYSLPVTVCEEFEPAELITTPAGEKVFDLGQNIAGVFRLRVHEPAGTKIRLQAGEILQQGNFYNENLRTAKAEYIYISGGEETVVEPKFTFYGYRYMKVEGIDDLKKSDFTGLALTSKMPRTGRVKTGNELIDRLILNTEWSMKDNFIDMPTDCPQRDERMGWTGDAQVFSPTAILMADTYAFYRKFLHDMSCEQAWAGGMVPDVIPSFGLDSCACAWGDAATIIPWHLYETYGDQEILAEQFQSMKDWVDYIASVDGDNHGWWYRFHYGDWLALDGVGGMDGVKGGTEDAFVAAVYYMYSTELVAKAAAVLGKTAEEKEYSARAAKIRADIVAEYYSANGRCVADTQTGNLLSLRHHLGPDPARCAERLVALLKENRGLLRTGFIGLPILAEELTAIGRSDLAYNLLFNEEYPGWIYEIRLGATTIWERWNSLLADGSISSTGMNSFNHYSYGSIVQWIYERAAGLCADREIPGSRRMNLVPQVDWRLHKIDASYDSPAGKWESGWEILDPRHIRVHAVVPFACSAALTLPAADEAILKECAGKYGLEIRDGRVELEAGSYEFCYETAEPLRKVLNADTPIMEVFGRPEARAFLEKHGIGISLFPDQARHLSVREISRLWAKVEDSVVKLFDEKLSKL